MSSFKTPSKFTETELPYCLGLIKSARAPGLEVVMTRDMYHDKAAADHRNLSLQGRILG